MSVAVVNKDGIPMMPTSNYRARKLLKSGRAVIYKYRPIFTICMLDVSNANTQHVEYKCDTGYLYIGVSICSKKHEFVNRQYNLLQDESTRNINRKKYRRCRRNRLRYRKPRWNNRKGKIFTDGFAPSLRNKRDCHLQLYEEYLSVFPITTAVFEMGQFDIQLLKAIENGSAIPHGKDYQYGEQYGIETLREAVFTRDQHTCIICKKKGILHVHHVGFWMNDHTNRIANLATVCNKCHTAKNHKPGGKLYGLKPQLKSFKDASFMNSIRWNMLAQIKSMSNDINVSITYGAQTKMARKKLKLPKTHSNDAYSMGGYHPKHRTDFELFQKRRRNNRILEKFYDSTYIDRRDGKKKTGSKLSCERTNRKESRTSVNNNRIYRGQKISKGRRCIRKRRYPFQVGDQVICNGSNLIVKGTHCNGKRVMLTNGKSKAVQILTIKYHIGGWMPLKKNTHNLQ